MATKTFTLYLAKIDIHDFEQLLTETAASRLSDPSTQTQNITEFGTRCRLYVFIGPPKEPTWYTELRLTFDLKNRVLTNSSCALVLFETSSRIFAASFAHGWMYLNDENFEGDFGLKTALNAVDESKLKRLERANLGDALRGVSLSPFQRDFRSFGVDDALDLVRKISGEAKDLTFAETLTGSKALKLSGECTVYDLPEIADECLQLYASESYKDTSFQVVDVVTPVSDPRLIAELDNQAVESIINDGQDFELGLPETNEEQSVAYKFSGPN